MVLCSLLPQAGSFPIQLLQQRFQWECVNDIGLGEPAFAGDAGAEAEEAGVFVPMRVAINNAFHALGPGVRPETPVQIEAIRVGVQFDPRARFRAGVFGPKPWC